MENTEEEYHARKGAGPSQQDDLEELRGNTDPDTGERGNTPPLGPPTPQSIDVGGDLTPIPEDAEDELTIETFYAELMSDCPLQPDQAYEETFGNIQPLPVQMMPDNTILFMAKTEDESVQHGNELLESASVYLHNIDENQETATPECDEIGPYVELCFTDNMAPIVLDETQHHNRQSDEVATMRVYVFRRIPNAQKEISYSRYYGDITETLRRYYEATFEYIFRRILR